VNNRFAKLEKDGQDQAHAQQGRIDNLQDQLDTANAAEAEANLKVHSKQDEDEEHDDMSDYQYDPLEDLTAKWEAQYQSLQLARQRITQLESDDANQRSLLQARDGEIARLVASLHNKDQTIEALELQSQQKGNEISSLRTSHEQDGLRSHNSPRDHAYSRAGVLRLVRKSAR